MVNASSNRREVPGLVTISVVGSMLVGRVTVVATVTVEMSVGPAVSMVTVVSVGAG